MLFNIYVDNEPVFSMEINETSNMKLQDLMDQINEAFQVLKNGGFYPKNDEKTRHSSSVVETLESLPDSKDLPESKLKHKYVRLNNSTYFLRKDLKLPLALFSLKDGDEIYIDSLLASASAEHDLSQLTPSTTALYPNKADELHQAIKKKDNKQVQQFIDDGVDLTAMDSNGETSLVVATKQRDVETVKLLLISGAGEENITVERWNYTALQTAERNYYHLLLFNDKTPEPGELGNRGIGVMQLFRSNNKENNPVFFAATTTAIAISGSRKPIESKILNLSELSELNEIKEQKFNEYLTSSTERSGKQWMFSDINLLEKFSRICGFPRKDAERKILSLLVEHGIYPNTNSPSRVLHQEYWNKYLLPVVCDALVVINLPESILRIIAEYVLSLADSLPPQHEIVELFKGYYPECWGGNLINLIKKYSSLELAKNISLTLPRLLVEKIIMNRILSLPSSIFLDELFAKALDVFSEEKYSSVREKLHAKRLSCQLHKILPSPSLLPAKPIAGMLSISMSRSGGILSITSKSDTKDHEEDYYKHSETPTSPSPSYTPSFTAKDTVAAMEDESNYEYYRYS